MKFYSETYNFFDEQTYVISGRQGSCVVIDPGFTGADETRTFMQRLDSEGLRPEAVLLTHGHPDHVCGVDALLEACGEMPVYMNPADKPVLDDIPSMMAGFGLPAIHIKFRPTDIHEGERITAAGLCFETVATPGHTPGGMCYLLRDEGILFTGDTLFAGCIGRTDIHLGEYDDEIRSIMEKLMVLDGDIRIFPGHGPSSTIARERQTNPFLEPFNEAEEDFTDWDDDENGPGMRPIIISGNS